MKQFSRREYKYSYNKQYVLRTPIKNPKYKKIKNISYLKELKELEKEITQGNEDKYELKNIYLKSY